MNSLYRMDVKKRLALVLSIAFLCMVALSGFSLFNLRNSELDAHRERIKSLVESAAGVANHYVKLADDGKLSTAEAQRQAMEAIRSMRYDNGNYYFIYNADGRAMMVTGSPQLEGKIMLGKIDAKGFKLWDAITAVAQNQTPAFLEYWFPRAGSTVPLPKIGYVAPIPEWHWSIGTGVYTDDINEILLYQSLHYGIGLLLVLLLTGIAGLMISRSIIRQLGEEPVQLMAIMKRAASGDLSSDFPLKGDINSVLANLKEMLGGLGNLARNIRQASSELEHNAEGVSAATNQVLGMASHQAEGTSSMAVAMEEMTVAINHIADNARDTEADSRQAAEFVHQGEQKALATVSKIQELAHSAQAASESVSGLVKRAEAIGSMTAMIKDVADQTNLLALNAAIEAARAGEAGRGFAVVADEVRKLAERTARSTIEIEQMVQAMQKDTYTSVELLNKSLPQAREGVELTEATAVVLREIRGRIQLTLDRVQEVAGSTREQSLASNSIAQQVERIANVVEETKIEMEKASREIESLERLSHSLETSVSRFNF